MLCCRGKCCKVLLLLLLVNCVAPRRQAPDNNVTHYPTKVQVLRCSLADSGIEDLRNCFSIQLTHKGEYIVKVTDANTKAKCGALCDKFAVRGFFKYKDGGSYVEILSTTSAADFNLNDKEFSCVYSEKQANVTKPGVVTSYPAEEVEIVVQDESGGNLSASLDIQTDHATVSLEPSELQPTDGNLSVYSLEKTLGSSLPLYRLVKRPGYVRLVVTLSNISRECGGLKFHIHEKDHGFKWPVRVEESCGDPEATGETSSHVYIIIGVPCGVVFIIIVIVMIVVVIVSKRRRLSRASKKDQTDEERKVNEPFIETVDLRAQSCKDEGKPPVTESSH